MNAPTPHITPDPYLDERFLTEMELLGALFRDNAATNFRLARAIVGPEHFSDPIHARIFARLEEGIEQGLAGSKAITWLISAMRGDKTLEEAKRPIASLIGRYISSQCAEIGVEGWARQIKHDALKGELASAVEEGDTAEAERIAAEMERLSKAHLQKDRATELVGDASQRALIAMSDAFQDWDSIPKHADTGFDDLSRQIGGWKRGRLYVVAGRPGMGKSTFGLAAMLRTALLGHGTVMFALEMSKDELIHMSLANLAWSREARIEYRDLAPEAARQPGYEEAYRRVYAARQRLDDLPFYLCDRGGLTMAEIRSEAQAVAQRMATRGKRLEVLCIDHMGLIKADTTYAGNKVAETEQISAALKMLAKELDCAVVALCQLSRQVEGRNDKRPNLSDLRWSGAIEQDADAVIFVYREAYYLTKKDEDFEKELARKARLEACRNRIELLVEKNRAGPTGSIELFCDIGCAVVRNAE